MLGNKQLGHQQEGRGGEGDYDSRWVKGGG